MMNTASFLSRRAGTTLLVLAVLFCLPGCFTFETLIRLQRNGSGTLEQVAVFSGPMLEMMRMFGGEDEGELDLCEQEDLLQQAIDLGDGVRLLESEPIEEDGRLGCRAVFAFEDINTLEIDQNPGEQMPSSMNPGASADPATPERITFRYDPGTPATLVVNMNQDYERNAQEPEEAPSEALPADSAQRAMQLEMMREMLGGASFRIALTVDGTITDTDAAYHDDHSVTFVKVDFDEMLKDEARFEALMLARPTSEEEAQALLKGVGGVEVETSEVVTIRFR